MPEDKIYPRLDAVNVDGCKTRITMVSQVFPSYHPMKGQPTYFIEKIWSALLTQDAEWYGQFLPGHDDDVKLFQETYQRYKSFEPKWHTIRQGHRYQAGDYMNVRVWTGKPYRSKQAEPFNFLIPIIKTWNFNIVLGSFELGPWMLTGETEKDHEMIELIAKNDGLEKIDFINWFKYPASFEGQIICWGNHINY